MSHSTEPPAAPEERWTIGQRAALSPHTIGADQRLTLAAERMEQLGVHQLPVLEGGQLVGMISRRDIAILDALRPEQLEHMRVAQAMAGVPYCVEPGASLSAVARHMARRKLGSAVVRERGKVVGIFTTTHALSALCELLGPADGEPSHEATH
ncbi:MAG: CBS domain-containing protein [Myxococcales bacterium]|nr:CBS domain-containing protein [Myxococcales bacterium]